MRKMLMTVVLGLAGCVGQAPTVGEVAPPEDLCGWRNGCDTTEMVEDCTAVYGTLNQTSAVGECGLLVQEAIACEQSMEHCPFAEPFRNPCNRVLNAARECIYAEGVPTDAGI